MASYLGYQLYRTPLDLQQPLTLAIGLSASEVQLTEVLVRPGKNRPADFQKFTQQFLGVSTWSRQCRIDNPQEVVVLYDKASQELTAVAPRGLRVLNPALGYRITYHNFAFKVSYRANRSEFIAAPVYEELKTTDARQQQRWQANRRQAYAGSLAHFLRSVRDDRLTQAGFVVRSLVRELRSPQAERRIALAGDSLAEVLTPAPGVVARVYRQPLSAAQIRHVEAGSGSVWLQFPAALQIIYQGEQPDAVYAASVALARTSYQVEAPGRGTGPGGVTSRITYTSVPEVSELYLLNPDALILPIGTLRNPLSVRVDGYWAFEKVGEALPLDYAPDLAK